MEKRYRDLDANLQSQVIEVLNYKFREKSISSNCAMLTKILNMANPLILLMFDDKSRLKSIRFDDGSKNVLSLLVKEYLL